MTETIQPHAFDGDPQPVRGVLGAPILGPRNGLRYPAYHRLDLRVTRRFRLRGGTLALYLDVTNLYGHNNVCCVDDFQYLPQADGSVRVEPLS